jgi:iron complex transport system substrate-binding protein
LLGRCLLILSLLWPGLACAADVVDATGRTVQVPDTIAHVLPAGPPAAVLLEALAPDLMLGWPQQLPDTARDMLPQAAAQLPHVPRVTGDEDVAARIKALHPDLILDYGNVSQRYADLARTTQAKTGIPTILLDGSLAQIPSVVRLLGHILHRDARAESIAACAATLLAIPAPQGAHPRVLYTRGPDGLLAAAPGTELTEVFTSLGWQVLAPEGQGTFRSVSFDDIRALDPDIVLYSDPAMRNTLAHDPSWRSLRAVRDGHAVFVPSLPFGWIGEPPSINRLLGLTWLKGRDPRPLAAQFNETVYGHALTPVQLDSLLAGVHPIQP